MAEADQYLRIVFAGGEYLLPGNASLAIEQRHNLTVNDSEGGAVAAWRVVRSVRWPAFALDKELTPVVSETWQRAVFLEARPAPVGLLADEIQILPRAELIIEPFTPLGEAPGRFGHLFNAAWINDKDAVLVFDPRALSAYLAGLGGQS